MPMKTNKARKLTLFYSQDLVSLNLSASTTTIFNSRVYLLLFEDLFTQSEINYFMASVNYLWPTGHTQETHRDPVTCWCGSNILDFMLFGVLDILNVPNIPFVISFLAMPSHF